MHTYINEEKDTYWIDTLTDVKIKSFHNKEDQIEQLSKPQGLNKWLLTASKNATTCISCFGKRTKSQG
jgi:hypothetical protein